MKTKIITNKKKGKKMAQNIKDRVIGEVFEFNGVKLVVEKCRDCSECYFDDYDCNRDDILDVAGFCSSMNRNDNETVVFKKLKNK